MAGKRRLTKQEAMGRVFVNVGKATCIKEMYTESPSFVVMTHDLSTLLGTGPTPTAAWIDAALQSEKTNTARDGG